MKTRILVVDDNEDIRLFVKLSLEDDGYQVIEANDGLSALEIFKSQNRCDLH